jgi:phospholipase/carboxylesterase
MTNEFIYRFEPAKEVGTPPLLLLHGTGGDENDLLQLGEVISPGSALLSPRGKVLERGMPRFFRRLTEGVFDEADVKRRANELADFVESARARYGLEAPVAVGYSNGANIAAAVMLLRPQVLAGAVLLRAMVPLAHPPKADLAHRPVLIASGSRDPIIPASNSTELAALLASVGANVQHSMMPLGHQLAQADVTLAKQWMIASDFSPIAAAPSG